MISMTQCSCCPCFSFLSCPIIRFSPSVHFSSCFFLHEISTAFIWFFFQNRGPIFKKSFIKAFSMFRSRLLLTVLWLYIGSLWRVTLHLKQEYFCFVHVKFYKTGSSKLFSSHIFFTFQRILFIFIFFQNDLKLEKCCSATPTSHN